MSYQPQQFQAAPSHLDPDPDVSDAHVIIAWVFAVISVCYFLPWAIAATRRTPASIGVMLLNLFLGWTGIGWIGALIWACLAEVPKRSSVVYLAPVLTQQPMLTQPVHYDVPMQPEVQTTWQQPSYAAPLGQFHPEASNSYPPNNVAAQPADFSTPSVRTADISTQNLSSPLTSPVAPARQDCVYFPPTIDPDPTLQYPNPDDPTLEKPTQWLPK